MPRTFDQFAFTCVQADAHADAVIREHGTVGLGSAGRAGQELLGGREDPLLIPGEGKVVLARQFDQPSLR
jgi:hypothetical protein